MILFLILCSMLLHLPSIFIVGKMPPVVQQMAFTSLIVCVKILLHCPFIALIYR